MASAVVVAGGRSTRFPGGEKALAPLDGRPMLARIVDRLAPVVDAVVVNCRPDQRGPFEAALPGAVTLAVDDRPDAGPLAGLRTGLAAAPDPSAVVVACDMPFVDPGLVAFLLDTVRSGGREAALPRPNDWFQPLQAAYRVGPTVAAADAALAAGCGRPLAAVERLDAATVGPADLAAHAAPTSLFDLDTRAAVAAARRALDRDRDDHG